MDARRREAERAAAQGDVQAQARLIAERLRSGELDRERVVVAALAGDPASSEVLGDQAPPPELDFARWVRRLQGEPVVRRVELALARCTLPAWEAALPDAPGPRAAIAAFATWLRTDDGADWEAFREAAAEAARASELVRLMVGIVADCATDSIPTQEELERNPRWIDWRPVWEQAVSQRLGLVVEQALAVIHRACSGPQGEASLAVLIESAFMPVRRVARILKFASDGGPLPTGANSRSRTLARQAQRVARELGAKKVRAAIRAELVPWALD